MTAQSAERWLPNGFPPPSFVVEPERRLSIARSRSLAAAVLLAAVLLVAGILVVTDDGDDGTDLTSGPTTTRPSRDSGGITGFGDQTTPSTTVLDPTAVGVEATTPPSSRQGSSPDPLASNPGTNPDTTVSAPPPAGEPGEAPGPPSSFLTTPTSASPSTTAPPTSSATTTTTAAPTPPTIEVVEPADGSTSMCERAWSVRANVEDASRIEGVTLVITRTGAAAGPVDMTPENSDGNRVGIWKVEGLEAVAPGTEVKLTIRAVDSMGAEGTAAGSFSCPTAGPLVEVPQVIPARAATRR